MASIIVEWKKSGTTRTFTRGDGNSASEVLCRNERTSREGERLSSTPSIRYLDRVVRPKPVWVRQTAAHLVFPRLSVAFKSTERMRKKILWAMRQQLISFGRTPSTMSGDQQALLLTWLMLHSVSFHVAPRIKTAQEAGVGGVDSHTAEARKGRCQHTYSILTGRTVLWKVIAAAMVSK